MTAAANGSLQTRFRRGSLQKRFRRRTCSLIAALGVCAIVVSTQGTGTTESSWIDREHAAVQVTAGVLGTPVSNDCGVSGRTFTPQWLPPATPSVAPARYEYRLYWVPALLGPREEVTEDWTAVGQNTQFAYTIPSALLRAGRYEFVVRAVRGTWISSERTGTAEVLAVLNLPISGCSWS